MRYGTVIGLWVFATLHVKGVTPENITQVLEEFWPMLLASFVTLRNVGKATTERQNLANSPPPRKELVK